MGKIRMSTFNPKTNITLGTTAVASSIEVANTTPGTPNKPSRPVTDMINFNDLPFKHQYACTFKDVKRSKRFTGTFRKTCVDYLKKHGKDDPNFVALMLDEPYRSPLDTSKMKIPHRYLDCQSISELTPGQREAFTTYHTLYYQFVSAVSCQVHNPTSSYENVLEASTKLTFQTEKFLRLLTNEIRELDKDTVDQEINSIFRVEKPTWSYDKLVNQYFSF